jgi:Domain of unknown function DUF11
MTCSVSPAGATSTTIGQVAPGTALACVNGPTDEVQPTVTSGPSYVVPAGGGVITSWTHNARAGAGQMLAMKVFRKIADPTTYMVVGHDGPRALAGGAVNGPFLTRIPVLAGDLLGLNNANASASVPNACAFSTAGNTFIFRNGDLADNQSGAMGGTQPNYRINISAVVESDADQDGFGDDTQDRCPGVAGTVNGCPQADFAVSETASPNPSPVHGRFSYLVQVRNNGPSTVPAGMATVADTVGPSVVLLSASSPGGACTLGAIVRCPVAALAPGASNTITLTVRADTEGGRANAATASYGGDTNPANDTAGVTATVVPAPSISGASASPKTWRLGSALPRFSRKAPIGTTIRFKLSQPAKATLTFSQPRTGRKVGRRCVATTRRNRRRPRCTIPNVRGTLTFNGHAGTNKVRFQGRLSRTKRLKPGRYTLTITAADSAGNRSSAKTVSFTILR